MKLVTLNVERNKHTKTVYDFLEKEQSDIICLQEATQEHQTHLNKKGYKTVFIPRCRSIHDEVEYIDGTILASRYPMKHTPYYYYKTTEEIPLDVFNPEVQRKENHQAFILGEIDVDGEIFYVATNHFTWTPDGRTPNQAQIDDMESFLKLVQTLPPHIMCGDFNIPRLHNYLYEDLLTFYKDAIPAEYKSSMDKKLHRLGDDASKRIMFTDFMVDYIFTQAPYRAENIRLEFGVSDHAAVVGNIHKE